MQNVKGFHVRFSWFRLMIWAVNSKFLSFIGLIHAQTQLFWIDYITICPEQDLRQFSYDVLDHNPFRMMKSDIDLRETKICHFTHICSYWAMSLHVILNGFWTSESIAGWLQSLSWTYRDVIYPKQSILGMYQPNKGHHRQHLTICRSNHQNDP